MEGKVIYAGENRALADALVSVFLKENSVKATYVSCLSELLIALSENNYCHLICELILTDAEKKQITSSYPNLTANFLAATAKPVPDFVSELASEDVKAALDFISIPIYYKNLAGNLVTCNTYFSQIFGCLPDDIIGQSVDELIQSQASKKLKPSEIKSLREGHVELLECEMADVSGTKRELLIREEASESGELRVGIIFDISEINAAKREIERDRVMLRTTADLSSDLIFFKDLESRFLGCNKQFEKFVGCSEADILGKKDDELFAIDQALMCQEQDADVMKSAEVYSGNEYLTYNNGKQHYIHMRKVPLRNKQGKVYGLVGIGRDITEKSIIKKQLKVANVVFENSRDGIIVTDGTGTVLTLNDACVEISGYSKSEFLDKNIISFASEPHYRRLFLEIGRSLKEDGKWQGNVNFRIKGGDLGYFWLEAYEVKHKATGMQNRVYAFTDLTQSKYNEEKIHYLSKHDSLTGLNNRIALFHHLESAISRSNHKQIPMAVLLIEMKGFKAINERYGHNQGDIVIKDVARRLKQTASDNDMVARIGDHKFVVVVEELENEQVVALIAQKLAQQFSKPINVEGMVVSLASSIGISICPDDGADLDTILSNAESAMLRSKQDKSSSYHFYTNELTVNSAQQMELEDELRRALEKDQFEVYYQPQYDLSKRQVVAMEALLRWHHPEQGCLQPSRFLMLAEQSGLLIDIGMMMFKKVALQASKWHQAGVQFGRIAINLSKLELSQISLIGSIQSILLETGCHPSWFEFSIEESLFSSDLYTVQDNLYNFSRLGIPLTVDGFGAERSVLYSIDKLNIEKFKISKHFIQGVPGYLAGEAMVKSVFVLAKSLGIDVVGEGLEDNQIQTHYELAQAGLTKEPMKACEATFYLNCYKRK